MADKPKETPGAAAEKRGTTTIRVKPGSVSTKRDLASRMAQRRYMGSMAENRRMKTTPNYGEQTIMRPNAKPATRIGTLGRIAKGLGRRLGMAGAALSVIDAAKMAHSMAEKEKRRKAGQTEEI